MVIVPCLASTVPVLSSCTGPTRLRLTDDGGGPKYDRGTFAPTDAGAGNRSQPGPGPIGPGPGPCAELIATSVNDSAAVVAIATGRFARRCMAIISWESGSLATGAACVA